LNRLGRAAEVADAFADEGVRAFAEAATVPITHNADQLAIRMRSEAAGDLTIDALAFRARPLAAADYQAGQVHGRTKKCRHAGVSLGTTPPMLLVSARYFEHRLRRLRPSSPAMSPW
jgi:hypothetical protein